ncbi:MAG: glutathione S-transferase family protein [Paracoccaceae bacterium]
MIRLHHCPQTRSMRSLWLLHELGIPFEVVTHGFDKTLRDPAYLALSPAGRVPALEIEDRTVFETGAICEILCEQFPEAGLGRAVDHPERQDWLVWLHFAETVSQHVAALTQQHIMLREDWMRSATVMKLEARRLERCYDGIEARLQGRKYLLEAFSAVDICVGQAVYLGRFFASVASHPAVAAWMERLMARPAFQASLPQAGEPQLYSDAGYAVPEAAS